MKKPCSLEGCSRISHSGGLCRPHSRRLKAYGSPTAGKRSMRGAPNEFIRLITASEQGDECIKWPFGRSDNGYGVAELDGRQTYAHRVVCIRNHGPPPSPDHQAAHWCGRGKQGCVNPKHIRWATASENQMDRVMHGTSNRGERSASAKLTNEEAIKIKSLKGKRAARDLAAEYGVCQATVFNIWSGAGWSWLAEKAAPEIADMRKEGPQP